MHDPTASQDRRRILLGMAAGAVGLYAPGAFAEALTQTPRQAEGPFYPDKLPLDTDNDLLILNDGITPAVGEITHLGGRILDRSGEPIRNAVVEIWQVDSRGVYIHTGCEGQDRRDRNFQGFGRFLTGSKGEYYFRTIKPVAYGDNRFMRAPHIHFAVKVKGADRFVTQLYIKGDALNEQDALVKAIKDPKSRELLMVDFKKIEGSKTGELSAAFNIVLGVTPA